MSHIRVVDHTGSTQHDLVTALAADPDAWPHLSGIRAVHQRAGRGRAERSWDTEALEALTLSVVLRPAGPIASWGVLGLLTAAAAARAIQRLRPGAAIGIKWPNDLVIDLETGEPGWQGIAKVGGVLGQIVPPRSAAQRSPGHAAVVGIGINLRLRPGGALPVPWARTLEHAGIAVGPGELTEQLLAELALLVPAGAAPTTAQAAAPLCRTLGNRVRAQTPAGTAVGQAEAMTDSGALLLRRDGGELQEVLVADVLQVRAGEALP